MLVFTIYFYFLNLVVVVIILQICYIVFILYINKFIKIYYSMVFVFMKFKIFITFIIKKRIFHITRKIIICYCVLFYRHICYHFI